MRFKVTSKMVSISKAELKKHEARERRDARIREKRAAKRFDGLGPHLKTKLRSAIREVWQRSSESRKIVVARCALPNGYSRCEHPACKGKKHPTVYSDHIVNCGDLDEGYIGRMFVPSKGLQGLCKKHHDEKTALEKKASKKKTVKKAKAAIKDFF
jgi:hypothetical protein